jgi:hypothetical protein
MLWSCKIPKSKPVHIFFPSGPVLGGGERHFACRGLRYTILDGIFLLVAAKVISAVWLRCMLITNLALKRWYSSSSQWSVMSPTAKFFSFTTRTMAIAIPPLCSAQCV